MIRRTQSLAIREIKTWLEEHSHDVLYTDQPGSSRGGVGDRANLNLAFEHLYDRTPDIVAVDEDNNLVIIEVDKRFDDNLKEKFNLYNNRRDVLTKRLREELNREITGVIFGFGTWDSSRPEVDTQYDPFYRFYLREEDARAVRV